MVDPALEIQKGRLGPNELRGWPIITLSKESSINQRIQAWFGDLFPDEFITVTHNNISVVAAMTMAGLGISVLPAVAYEKEISAGRLRVLDTDPSIPSLELHVARPKGRVEPLVEPIAALAMQVSEFPNR
jgi:DNA-binding transcriptional LysR family regulator